MRALLAVLALLAVVGRSSAADAQAGPPVPEPLPGRSVVQFVNESPATVLLGVFGPTPVTPREGTWELPPGGWLTLDIPTAWRNTIHPGDRGPRFWARTGCRYDRDRGIAQCETGDCGGRYDCSAAQLAGRAPVTLAEFCFKCGNNFNYWNVSAMDGASLFMTIQPLGHYSPDNPRSPGDTFWCTFPDAVAGADLRANCPVDFQLRRSDLGMFIAGDPDGVVACLCSADSCTGDDTAHAVFPRASTGPDDPQTYHCDARIFRVTFAPGGTGVPITESGGIPVCSTLPAVYGYEAASPACSGVAGKEFAGARRSPHSWDCAVGDLGRRTFAATDGVLCRWSPLPPAPACHGRPATIYVRNGTIVGGPDHGKSYRGILRGTPGDDVIVGTAGRDSIMGFAGHDVICGGEGSDMIDAGDGDDRIDGGPGHDVLKGHLGRDSIYGGDGDDRIDGGPGHDQLDGGAGKNRSSGGTGADTCVNGTSGTSCLASSTSIAIANALPPSPVCPGGNTVTIFAPGPYPAIQPGGPPLTVSGDFSQFPGVGIQVNNWYWTSISVPVQPANPQNPDNSGAQFAISDQCVLSQSPAWYGKGIETYLIAAVTAEKVAGGCKITVAQNSYTNAVTPGCCSPPGIGSNTCTGPWGVTNNQLPWPPPP